MRFKSRNLLLLCTNLALAAILLSGCAGRSVPRIFRGGLAGGQTGTWDPHDADQALSQAISKALDALVANYARNISGR